MLQIILGNFQLKILRSIFQIIELFYKSPFHELNSTYIIVCNFVFVK